MDDSQIEKLRPKFESDVFRARFLASVARNPNENRAFEMTFISTDCPDKADLVARNPAGDYKDESVDAMWFGYRLAVERVLGQFEMRESC